MIGTDGMQLLIAVWAEDVPDWLAHVPGNTREKDSLYPCNTRVNIESLPSNTRYEEEIEVLKAEIQNLSQKLLLTLKLQQARNQQLGHPFPLPKTLVFK